MDLEKRLLNNVRNRSQRDAAFATLAKGYRRAVEGTRWEDFSKQLKTRALEDAGPPDWLELREIEDRGVACVWPVEGLGRAWVWTRGRWKEAPGLLTKLGYRLGRYQFKREFPDARLEELFPLVEAFLGKAELERRVNPPIDPRFERDQFLMEAGYRATLHHLRAGLHDFPSVFEALLRNLGCEYDRLRPYVTRWYFHAIEEHGPFESSTNQPLVDDWLEALDAVQAAEQSSRIHCDEDRENDFLWQLPKALSAFTEREFERVARKVRHTLQRGPASGIFGASSHRNHWHEYCHHAHLGPPELDQAFDALVAPLIDYRLDQLECTTAVLLTIAQQWETEELEHQDGRTISSDLLRNGIRNALERLALNTDCDFYEG